MYKNNTCILNHSMHKLNECEQRLALVWCKINLYDEYLTYVDGLLNERIQVVLSKFLSI